MDSRQTHMHSVLLDENRNTFFQGCGELDVLFMGFEERFDARPEGLIIYRVDGMNRFDTGSE